MKITPAVDDEVATTIEQDVPTTIENMLREHSTFQDCKLTYLLVLLRIFPL